MTVQAITFHSDDHAVWQTLMSRQLPLFKNRACDEYIHGLTLLNFPIDRIPDYDDISKKLKKYSGFTLHPVPGYLSTQEFFTLLAKRQFPVAAFIRSNSNLDYSPTPDVFHELVGHCPMLTQLDYANFFQAFAELLLQQTEAVQTQLSNLFCFTAELGLIRSNVGLRVYGGGILSSPRELVYALESDTPLRLPFNLKNILQTPYQIATLQSTYFIIDNFSTFYDLIKEVAENSGVLTNTCLT